MKKQTVSNNQKIINRQGNIKINAWWDVYNWPYQQNTIDNSWYSIEKEETALLEKVSKFIIENIWKIWGIISGVVSLIIWGITTVWNFLDFFSTYKPKIIIPTTGKIESGLILGNLLEWLLDWHILLMIMGGALVIGWIIILNSMKYRNQSQCPKCKKHYGLVEIGEPMEKETKTSKGYRVTQIRHYKCNGCGFEKEKKTSFVERKE